MIPEFCLRVKVNYVQVLLQVFKILSENRNVFVVSKRVLFLFNFFVFYVFDINQKKCPHNFLERKCYLVTTFGR